MPQIFIPPFSSSSAPGSAPGLERRVVPKNEASTTASKQLQFFYNTSLRMLAVWSSE